MLTLSRKILKRSIDIRVLPVLAVLIALATAAKAEAQAGPNQDETPQPPTPTTESTAASTPTATPTVDSTTPAESTPFPTPTGLPASQPGPTPTPSDTLSGEASDTSSLYIDSQFGFSVPYPSDWQLDSGEIVDAYAYVWEVQFYAPVEYLKTITITVQPLDDGITSSGEWASNVLKAYGYTLDQLTADGKLTEVDIQGVTGYRANLTGSAQGETSLFIESTYFVDGSFGYVITTMVDMSHEEPPDLTVYDAALSGFTPGDKQPTIEPQAMTSAAAAATADSFGMPLSGAVLWADFDQHPSVNRGVWSQCLGTYWEDLWHAAEDWGIAEGSPVRAVANGVVAWYNSSYNTYPGRVVIVRHDVYDGTVSYSVYSHLEDVYIYQGKTITKGEVLGTIYNWPDNSHLHWEIRNFLDGTYLCNSGLSVVAGPGYSYPGHPQAIGYVDPGNYVLNHLNGVPIGDSYEPDNNQGQAREITPGTSQTHSILPANDIDWLKFTLSHESYVNLETFGTDNSDTRMWLYNASLTEIEYNDDKVTGDMFSRIDRVCGADALPAGTYYVEIDEYNNNNEIQSYTASMQADPCAEGTFNDVPPDYWVFNYIKALSAADVTSGCGNGNYCPEAPVTRAQMAVFLERAMQEADFTPPAPTGQFSDVPTNHWAAAWIEQLANDGITSGCGGSNYCPEAPVTRAQMAVFLERAMQEADFTPPAPTGQFSDVPTSHWAAAWIEQLADDGVTSGCGGGNYCPETPVTRAQMAVFLTKAFNLPLP